MPADLVKENKTNCYLSKRWESKNRNVFFKAHVVLKIRLIFILIAIDGAHFSHVSLSRTIR